MRGEIDALTSAALKYVRERWWDDDFTEFLRETLRPRVANRILDVGCGVGTAELALGNLGLSQLRLIAVDLLLDRVRQAASSAAGHNVRAEFAVADACHLPFGDGIFDSTFCVAVLQHVHDLSGAVQEFARVTRLGGRIVVVEPDNAARYWYSSSEIGNRVSELAMRFFNALADALGDSTDPAVGPKLSAIFAQHGIEPITVELFPVSLARLGAPSASTWENRRAAVRSAIQKAPNESIRRLGEDYLKLLNRYADEAKAAGSTFVEIQNTLLFATVGQRPEESRGVSDV